MGDVPDAQRTRCSPSQSFPQPLTPATFAGLILSFRPLLSACVFLSRPSTLTMSRMMSTSLLLLATAMIQTQLALATVVSIRDEPAFKAMRECARDCLVWNGSIDLIGELGCVYPYQNECLCRPDLAPAASKHLSTCGSTYCTVGPASGDISTAIGLYNSYCVANGFDVTAVAAVAPKTTLATQTNQGKSF